MKRMKTFWTYFLLFVGLYLFVSLVIYFGTKQLQKTITNFEILSESPKIAIEESKGTYSKGYIKGTITNTGDKIINKTYIKIDLYNSNKQHLATKYKEIKYLNVKETQKFNIIYRCSNVDYITLEVVENVPEEVVNQEKELIERMDVIVPFAFLLFLYYMVP